MKRRFQEYTNITNKYTNISDEYTYIINGGGVGRSIGVVIYEMLSGAPPFFSDRSVAARIHQCY